MNRLLVLGALSLIAVAAVVTACAGGSSSDAESHWPQVLELKDREITPVPVQHTLTVGDDRFSLGLQNREDQLILRAEVNFRFFKIEGEDGTLKAETPATYVGFDTNFVHEHEDGTRHTHLGPEVGVYVAKTTFDEAGDWGVEVRGAINGNEFEPLRMRFGVTEKGTLLANGDSAPRSRQVTLRDVADISEIDSTNPPNPEMHELTVAEALDTGKPVVVAFATPAFCTSRTCGPVMDKVVVPLFGKYGDRVVFVHIEPYFLREAREGVGFCPVPAFNRELAQQGAGGCPKIPSDQLPPSGESWNLETEPWVFVVDGQGRIAGKFEGIMGVDEVEAVLQQVLR